MRPVTIPPTSPRRYVSFHRALNLRRKDELTGDWHALTAWFREGDGPNTLTLAGKDQAVDTTPSLGARGVREMGPELRARGVPVQGPAWVASHPRAIADLVMLDLLDQRTPRIAGVHQINAWLDAKEQVDELRDGYLAPLRGQLGTPARAILDAWLPAVRFEA